LNQMEIAYFCSDGYTELGAIQNFLEKITSSSSVSWIRAFPAKLKPGPKLRKVSGISGDDLNGEMLKRLDKYKKAYSTVSAVVLVDDADCRFRYGNDEASNRKRWKNERQKEISRILDSEIPFLPLFASPEIEAWFVSDWEKGFGKQYPELANQLRREVISLIYSVDNIEQFGVRKEDSGKTFCDPKLSDKIAEIIKIHGGSFSKKHDGPEMLHSVEPDNVAKHCTFYFKPALVELRRHIENVLKGATP